MLWKRDIYFSMSGFIPIFYFGKNVSWCLLLNTQTDDFILWSVLWANNINIIIKGKLDSTIFFLRKKISVVIIGDWAIMTESLKTVVWFLVKEVWQITLMTSFWLQISNRKPALWPGDVEFQRCGHFPDRIKGGKRGLLVALWEMQYPASFSLTYTGE